MKFLEIPSYAKKKKKKKTLYLPQCGNGVGRYFMKLCEMSRIAGVCTSLQSW